MKRRLVLTHEAARHSFRRALPPPPSQVDRPQSGDNDVKLFLLSFTAFFICFYTMIA